MGNTTSCCVSSSPKHRRNNHSRLESYLPEPELSREDTGCNLQHISDRENLDGKTPVNLIKTYQKTFNYTFRKRVCIVFECCYLFQSLIFSSGDIMHMRSCNICAPEPPTVTPHYNVVMLPLVYF